MTFLPREPSMSQAEMRRRMVVEEEALEIPPEPRSFFGRSCRALKRIPAEALPRQTPQKTSDLKDTTSCVETSLLGQQKVSSLGEAIASLGETRGSEWNEGPHAFACS